MASKKPHPTFEIVFKGRYPESIPVRTLYETFQAVQRLATGEAEHVTAAPAKSPVGLLSVRRGSAVVECLAHEEEAALRRLHEVGDFLAAEDAELRVDQDYVLRPLEIISDAARSLDCEIQVRTRSKEGMLLAIIRGDSYAKASRNALVSGMTTVYGRVIRVGGATERRCTLRVPGRHYLLYCNVATEKLSRKLGRHLYENIAATGQARWFHRSWRIFSFTIHDISQPKSRSLVHAFHELGEQVAKAWKGIDDPEAYIRDLRET